MIENATTWAHGDMAQGKVMLVAGGIVLLAAVLAWMNGGEMLRGMIIPMGLIILLCAGYGGFMQINRAAHIQDLAVRYKTDQVSARTAEIARMEKDCRNYRIANFLWTGVVLLGVALLFLSGTVTWRGAALGLVLLAATGFLVDNFLHERAELYLAALRI